MLIFLMLMAINQFGDFIDAEDYNLTNCKVEGDQVEFSGQAVASVTPSDSTGSETAEGETLIVTVEVSSYLGGTVLVGIDQFLSDPFSGNGTHVVPLDIGAGTEVDIDDWFVRSEANFNGVVESILIERSP